MERGEKIVVVNPDSSFFGREGKVAQVRPAKEVVLIDVVFEDRIITFIQGDIRRREID